MLRKIALVLPDGTPLNPIPGMPSGGILDKTIPSIMTFLFVGASLLALGFLIYGGIKWITSGGDKAGVESARNTIVYAIIGLIIVFFSFAIVNTIGEIFGVKLLGKCHLEGWIPVGC